MLHCLQGHRLAVLHARFSFDGRRVITGGEDFRAVLWDADTGLQLLALAAQTDRVTCVGFSPQGTRLLTGCGDRTVKLWDAATGREILTLSGHTREVTSVSFSPDGQSVLSSSRDGTAIVWPSMRPSAEGQEALDVPVNKGTEK
jgi:WD40 repeat protein